jgi:acetate kinase
MKKSTMNPNETRILTINGGSSSIKFALFQDPEPLQRRLSGKIDRIGLSGATFSFNDLANQRKDSQSLAASDHQSAANTMFDWLEAQPDFASVRAVGHRVVHGMKHTEPELVTPEVLDELNRLRPSDPAAPSEIAASGLLRHGFS